MEGHLLGQICALGAAVCWAFALVLFKRSGERVPPLSLNLFKNVVALVLLGATLGVRGDGIGRLAAFPATDICILLVSGVIGIALADTVFFHALNLLGVGLTSIVDCTYSPFIILFSCLLLGEELTVFHLAGAGLILGGVLTASRVATPQGRTRTQLVVGMVLGALSMALMGYSIVLAKPVLERFPLVWATVLRLSAGTLVLALWTQARPQRAAVWAVFRPSAVWWLTVPASVLGAYLALVLWIAGFKYTSASIAALLNQTTVVFALIFATLLLKESFSRRKFVAVLLALAGVAVVRLAPT